MFLNANSLQIKKSGGNYINLGQYLTQVEYGYNKLWANDTGRNLKGKTTGTLLGIVPKIKLSFHDLTQSELETLAPILNSAWQTTKFYSPQDRAMIEIQTYTGDWATTNKNTFANVARANEGFEISLIATTPR